MDNGTLVADLLLNSYVVDDIAFNNLKCCLSGVTVDDTSNVDTYTAVQTIVKAFGGNVISSNYQYSFAAFSDIHLCAVNDNDHVGDGNGLVDFTRALSIANTYNVEFACIAGDIGQYHNLHQYTDRNFDDCIASANVNYPIYCCTGNHDQGYSEAEWYNTTSCHLSTYSIVKGNDVFVFLSLSSNTSLTGYASNVQEKPYTDESIDQLEEILNSNPHKRMFLFMHFPLNSECPYPQYAGLGQLKYPSANTSYKPGNNSVHNEGFKLDSNWHNDQNTRILNLLKSYNGVAIVFSGHTHFIDEVEQYNHNMLYAKVSDNVHTVHIPSLNYPRDRDRNTICSSFPDKQPSQGYIVDCYDSKIVLHCHEFNTNIAINNTIGDDKRMIEIPTK